MGNLRGRRELGALDARTVVERTVEDAGWFKWAVLELETRERADCERAAQAVVAAHARGAIPPWLAAVLSGACRSDAGYDVCLAILEAGHGLLSESYAGAALARIRGAEARDDLCRVVETGRTLSIREGALHGLDRIGLSGDGTDRLFRWLRERKVRADNVGHHLARRPMDDPTALEWLSSPEPRHRQAILRMTLVRLRPAPNEHLEAPSPVLVDAILAAMDDGRLYESQRNRATLEAAR